MWKSEVKPLTVVTHQSIAFSDTCVLSKTLKSTKRVYIQMWILVIGLFSYSIVITDDRLYVTFRLSDERTWTNHFSIPTFGANEIPNKNLAFALSASNFLWVEVSLDLSWFISHFYQDFNWMAQKSVRSKTFYTSQPPPPGGGCLLPYKSPSLMEMCRWMGSHFHDWIDHNGVAISLELLEWQRMGSHIFRFLGKAVLHISG